MSYRISEKVMAWLPEDEIEQATLDQIKLVAKLPFIHQHVALMPDCHLGIGSTVGSMVPTKHAIVPAVVGVDIGCGMIAVKTELERSDLPDDLRPLRESIERRVPLSHGGRNQRLSESAQERVRKLSEVENTEQIAFYDQIAPHWKKQLGSLGSGNHFIEVVLDEAGGVWAFLHSGSRGVGNKIATHHIAIAKNRAALNEIELPHSDLAYFEQGQPEFDAYLRDMFWAQTYARENRAEMMDRVMVALAEAATGDPSDSLTRVETIQCHHNFTQLEQHYDEMVYVSRKGAIRASEGVLGLIPGSMGTRSYVVRGKGNAESFCTAPHGAGRRFSRRQARKRFTVEDLERDMKGIESSLSPDFLDEVPGAYKDVDHVIEQSADLVEVLHTFRQIVNVKGAGFQRRRRRK